MAEAWVATFKTELVDWIGLTSHERVEHETLAWISFYNHERLHEALGDVPPAEFEATERPESADEPGVHVPASPAQRFRGTAQLRSGSSRKDPPPVHDTTVNLATK
ncbi:MAG: transposase [Actinobacteria bacterium]|nr:transposase [Actinomycetota bacterium]